MRMRHNVHSNNLRVRIATLPCTGFCRVNWLFTATVRKGAGKNMVDGLSGSCSVRHFLFGQGENRFDSIGVADIEQHTF